MIRKSTQKKIASYSAFVSAVLAVSKEADGQILYTDIVPDDTTIIVDSYLLDLNNDGVMDFNFNLQFPAYGYGNQIRVIGYGSNSISRDLTNYPNSWQGYQYAKALNSGDLIGAANQFEHQEILGSHYTFADFGNWVGVTDRFLGLKLVANSNTYYGWARLTVPPNCDRLIASDYAIDTIANEAIMAGDKCGNYSAYANTVITPSDSVVVCAENIVLLTADSTGSVTYQWLMDNNLIAGATDVAYFANATGNYSVIVTTLYGCTDTSAGTQVTVLLPLTAPVISQSGETLTSTAASTYQWYLNNVIIPGATNQSYDPVSGGDYTVEISDENGCTNISDPYTFIPIGISNSDLHDIDVFVVSHKVFIRLYDKSFLGGQLKIFNAPGEEVYSIVVTNENFQIDLNSVAAGVYLLTIDKNGKSAVKKMVIQ